MSNNHSVDGAPRESGMFEATSPSAPAWPPPKSPLSPHRLAKLANALGISAPMPSVHAFSPFVTPPSFPGSPADVYRRSPTPSVHSNRSPSPYPPTTSKYLLHVIPPLKLPHDSEDSEYTPPPAAASGYHTQFRRGIFVPLHSTLQSQLSAIAKEYALPSTTGLILYLASSKYDPAVSQPSSTNASPDPIYDNDFGPRLSEDMWKHIWTRVMSVEQEEASVNRSLSLSPQPSLGSKFGARSSPHLLQDYPGLSRRPSTNSEDADGLSRNRAAYPSPSTPTSMPDTVSPQSKSSSPSSREASQYEPSTPDTSISSDTRSNSLDLPGLKSNSIIPTLAKVEFDIDRRIAKWFDPWLRSRRLNQSKRFANQRNDTGELHDGEKRPPLQLALAGLTQPTPLFTSPLSAKDVAPFLFDSDHSDSDPDEDATARVPSLVSDEKDSLVATVDAPFSSDDGDSRPHLSLSIPDTTLPTPISAAASRQSLHRKNAPPPLVLHSNQEHGSDEEDSGPHSSLPYLNAGKVEASSEQELLFVEDESFKPKLRSPASVRRTGVFYEGLDLGLDRSEESIFVDDEEELDEQTKDQYELTARLDEIERNLAQFSPRVLSVDLENEQSAALSGLSLSAIPSPLLLSSEGLRNADVFPPTPDPHSTVFDTNRLSHRAEATGELPKRSSPPRLAVNGVATSPPRVKSVEGESSHSLPPDGQTVFMPGPSGSSGSPSTDSPIIPVSPGSYPPYSTPAPRRTATQTFDSPVIPLSPDPFGRYPSTPASEEAYGASRQSQSYWESGTVTSTGVSDYYAPSLAGTESSSSRFSTDSTSGLDTTQKRTTMLSVKGMKKLWRKSNKQSISAPMPSPTPPPPTPSLSSFPQVVLPPSRQRTPSISNVPPTTSQIPPLPGLPGISRDRSASTAVFPQQNLEMPSHQRDRSASVNTLPITPTFGVFPSQAPPRPNRPSAEEMVLPDIPNSLNIQQYQSRNAGHSPIVASKMQRAVKALDRFHFDQESPYPIHRSVHRQSPPRRPVSPLSHSPAPSVTPPILSWPSESQASGRRPPSLASITPSVSTTPPLPASASITDVQKATARKSILKWKSVASSAVASTTPAVTQEGERRPSISAGRSRRPSVNNFGSLVNSPEFPPTSSPKIPEQYLPQLNSTDGVFHLKTPSTDSFPAALRKSSLSSSMARSSSPAQSINSSQYSGDRRPSIDSSQFEMVSPKTGSLAYPYTSVDHD